MRRRSPVRANYLLVLGFLLVSFGWLTWQTWPDRRFHLWVLDVGQGNAELIVTPKNQQILYDGGPDDAILAELGRHMPFWDRKIEYVIISHFHADHITGLIEIMRRYEIGELWLSGASYTTHEYKELMQLVSARTIPTRIVTAGEQETIDNVTLSILHPFETMAGATPVDPHDANIVVQVTIQDRSVLLTGDLDEQHEEAILASFCPLPFPEPCPPLASDVLLVPHHGSGSGLQPEFLRAVDPRSAIISAGARNRFGHPHPTILDRLTELGIEIWRTDHNGTLGIELVGSDLVVTPDGL